MKFFRATATPYPALLGWTTAVAAAWLAVATQFWAQTWLLALLGLGLLLFPPSRSIPRWPLLLGVLLVLLATIAFLPAAWFGTAFRAPFQQHGIVLPSTLTCQPWISFEDLTLLIATLLWSLCCLGGNLSNPQRQFLLTNFLLALGLVAVIRVWSGLSSGLDLPMFLQNLGQFENQNQTGDLYMLGGVLSFAWGLSEIARKKTTGILWIALTVVFFIAIIENSSRASLILFSLGLFILCLLLPGNARHVATFRAILFFVVMAGLLVFLAANSTFAEKFGRWFDGNEFRLPIYRDAASMIPHVPWCGIGLGNFEGVFNTMRPTTVNHSIRILHPESDWFWAAIDLGPFSVIIVALLLYTLCRDYFSKISSSRLMAPCALVGFLFLLHTFCDVGGHRLGSAWTCIFLVSLGTNRTPSLTDIKLPSFLLRSVGLLFLVLAVLRVQSMSVDPWMPTRASVAAILDRVSGKLPLDEKKVLLDRGVTWTPLNWQLYYQRGLVLLQTPNLAAESSADFDRTLFLDQSSIEIPKAIATSCFTANFPETLVASAEILKRAGDAREKEFRHFYDYPGMGDAAYMAFTNLAGSDPNLQAISVEVSKQPPQFNWLLQNLLQANPSLAGISPENLRTLLDRWAAIGDSPALIEAWEQYPDWRIPGWRAYATALAKSGRYRDAAQTGLTFLPPSEIPKQTAHPSLDDASRQFQADPHDSYSGMMLYLAQTDAGMKDDALQTLVAVCKLPSRPASMPLLLTRQLLDRQQDEAAWQALQPLIDND